MARITLRQLLDHAETRGYAVPAFNINNMEQGIAIMQAAAAVDAPVIIQASRGARSYAGDIMLSHMIDALERTYPDIPLCMHQDHGNDEATCASAIANGFTSVMMKPAMDAMRDLCRVRFEQFGAAGHASRIKVIPMSEMARRYRAGELDPRVEAREHVAA